MTTTTDSISWEYPNLMRGETACTYRIGGPDANATIVRLDAKPTSDLSWKEELESAEAAIAQGHAILWELDLGLFDQLEHPLTDRGQFETLGLAVDHFFEKVWSGRASKSVGCILYRGPLGNTSLSDHGDFTTWLSDLYGTRAAAEEAVGDTRVTDAGIRCRQLHGRDVMVHYLQLLAERLRGEVPPFAVVDVAHIANDPLLQGQLLDRSEWGGIIPMALGYTAVEPLRSDATSLHIDADHELPAVAFCLPASEELRPPRYHALGAAAQQYARSGKPFRWIPEEFLVTEWHGVDHLVVDPTLMDTYGLRKLRGFQVAGGNIVTVAGTYPEGQGFSSFHQG